MKGVPNTKIAALVRQDAELIILNAAVVIYLNDGGSGVLINENPYRESPCLPIMAVVGPSFSPLLNQFFNQAVLLEVGIGTGVPYKRSTPFYDPTLSDARAFFAQRRKWFWLTKEQYVQIAPLLFAEMQKIVNRRVAGREKRNHLNPPFKSTKRLFHSHRKRTLFKWKEKVSSPPGSRFSISIQDRFLLSDVYWLEKQTDAEKAARRDILIFRLQDGSVIRRERHIVGRTESLAHRIAKRLMPYAKNGTKWRPERIKGFKDIDEFVAYSNYSNLPAYKREQALELIKANHGLVYARFRDELEKHLDLSEQIAPETELICQVLPNPEHRLTVLRQQELERHVKEVARQFGWNDGLLERYKEKISSSPAWNKRYQILVTGGLGRRTKKGFTRNYIVFEMTHNLPTELTADSETNTETNETTSAAPVP